MPPTSKWTSALEQKVLTVVQTFEAEGRKVDFDAIANYLNGEFSMLENDRFLSNESLSPNNSLPFQEKNLLPFKVTRVKVYDRWRNHIDPKLIKACYTKYEFKVIIVSQRQLRPNNYAFLAEVLQRPPDSVKNTWKTHMQKVLSTKVKSLTGRDNLKVSINGVEKYDFGSEAQMEQCVEAVWDVYKNKKGYVANNDKRTVTEDTLPMERLLALAEAKNVKNAEAAAGTAKRRATAATKAERDSQRAKRADDVLSVLKTKEEVKRLEDAEPNSEWVKAKNKAHKAFLWAGHSEESISKFLDVVRTEMKSKPLGRSQSDARRDWNAKKSEENRKFLADRTNTM